MKILMVLTFIILVSSSSATEQEIQSAMSSRTLCCLFSTSSCVAYCAGRSCSATCTVRCGVLLSNCGTFTCSEVSPDTCSTTTAAPTTTAATAASTTCVAGGEACTVGASEASQQCCSPTTCTPNAQGTGGNCINTGG